MSLKLVLLLTTKNDCTMSTILPFDLMAQLYEKKVHLSFYGVWFRSENQRFSF